MHTDLGSVLWFMQQFKCEEIVNPYGKIYALPVEESRTCSDQKHFISRWNYRVVHAEVNFIDCVMQRDSVDTNFGQNSRQMENVGQHFIAKARKL